jgi:hypothetical protein
VKRYGTLWRRAWPIALVAIAVTFAAKAADTPQPQNNPPAEAPAPAPAATPAPAEATPAAPAAEAPPNQIGRSILVVNEVSGQAGDAPPQHITVNDNIVFAEDITTGSDAKTVLEFRDGSTFEIGSDAAIRIDSFIFNPEESTSHKAVQVTRGVFRYVSGYVASDQDTKISTPAGEMGIRGSVVEGVVDPSVPDFLYVGEGNATFTNGAGGSNIEAGGAIAVPSSATPPMAPAAMPPAVAAQAVEAIDRHLPPRAALQSRPENEAWLKQSGAADLVPVAEQRQQQAAVSRPPPTVAARGSMAGELGLLAEGNRVGMFRGGQGARTPEQNEFLARAARDNPRAIAFLQRHQVEAREMHRASMAAGTALVIHGVGRAASSPEVLRRVTAASVRANPGAAAAIQRHAGEATRGRVFSEPNRHEGTAPAHPEERHFEQRGPAQNREARPN